MCNLPVHLLLRAPVRVLASGAYLKNRACLVDGERVSWSPLHGDLDQVDACLALETSVEGLLRQSRQAPQAVAHDLHPDFFSTRLASTAANTLGVQARAVQHHHAHIATTIAERGICSPVIGIALDGVGLGSDGTAWGGELLWVNGGLSAHRWRRLAHLHPIAMPGGDRAAREPWRLAAALLHDTGRSGEIEQRFAPFVGPQAASVVRNMLRRGLNCPGSTSAGRWFDTAAAALGLSVQQSSEAEAAQLLERLATDYLAQHPNFEFLWQSLDLRPMVAALFQIGSEDAMAVARGAATFHLALINALAHAAIIAARDHGVQDVVLGGGCFVNAVLRERLADALRNAQLRVHVPTPSLFGDAGLALGQAWVAACSVHETAEVARFSSPELRPIQQETC